MDIWQSIPGMLLRVLLILKKNMLSLRAGGTSELSVSFSGAPGAYRAYIYAVRDGSAWLKASGRVEIPESGSARAVFRAGFDAPGEFCTLVKVCDYGGALLASRQGLYPDRIFAP